MIDSCGRRIDYMRVSITDRCNLRCRYCMPEDQPFIEHDQILRYEEIIRVCRAAATIGVRNIKITGGEPLVRRGCCDLIAQIKALPGVEHVTVTTNGVLLADAVPRFHEIGVDGVNISLDTLRPDVYAKITGRDCFEAVQRGLYAAIDTGLRVKINCVPLAGVNEDELCNLAMLARDRPVDVRFIEMMPIGLGGFFEPVPVETVRAHVRETFPDLKPDPKKHGFGPARYFTCDALKGSIGFIEAVSHSFCTGCNRVRLTSEGFFKLCLYHDDGADLRVLLRGGADDDAIAEAMRRAILEKPRAHAFEQGQAAEESRGMSQIGG